MTGRTLSLRALALVFGLACAIFAIMGGYSALLVNTSPMIAPAVMAAVTAFIAVSLLLMAQFRATRRRARFTAIMSNLIDHKPMAGLAAAVIAGAAARFGVEPDDLFPIFEAFTKEPQPEGDTADNQRQHNDQKPNPASNAKTSPISTSPTQSFH